MARWVVDEPELQATFTRDPIGGRVYWSPELCELFGIEPGEFEGTGRGCLRRVHPSDQARIRLWADSIAKQPRRFVEEMRIVRPDGAVRRIRVSGEALEGAEGETILIAGAAEDISEQEIRRPELAVELGLR